MRPIASALEEKQQNMINIEFNDEIRSDSTYIWQRFCDDMFAIFSLMNENFPNNFVYDL